MSTFETIPQFVAASIQRVNERKTLFQYSQWFFLDKLEVYMRGGPTFDRRDNDGDMLFVPALVVSTITVKPEFRRQGVLKAFLQNLIDEHKNDFKYLIVEQVVFPPLAKYLSESGYKKFQDRDLSFYLDLEALR